MLPGMPLFEREFFMLARPFKLALLVLFASIAFTPRVQAEDKVLKVGTLKLIHGISAYFYEKFVPAGYTVEVFPFESPNDGKNAVLTGTVDTCIQRPFCSAPRPASRY
jgi:NitT/TauT family transport system substrate-binding protein